MRSSMKLLLKLFERGPGLCMEGLMDRGCWRGKRVYVTLFITSISVGSSNEGEKEEEEEEEEEEVAAAADDDDDDDDDDDAADADDDAAAIAPACCACCVASLCARSGVKIASRTRARADSVATRGSKRTPFRDPKTSIGPATHIIIS